MKSVDNFRRKEHALGAAARYSQPMLNVPADCIPAHRRQTVVTTHALIDLSHLRQLQLGMKLGLSNEDDL
jgi:hypothetical protein